MGTNTRIRLPHKTNTNHSFPQLQAVPLIPRIQIILKQRKTGRHLGPPMLCSSLPLAQRHSLGPDKHTGLQAMCIIMRYLHISQIQSLHRSTCYRSIGYVPKEILDNQIYPENRTIWIVFLTSKYNYLIFRRVFTKILQSI